MTLPGYTAEVAASSPASAYGTIFGGSAGGGRRGRGVRPRCFR